MKNRGWVVWMLYWPLPLLANSRRADALPLLLAATVIASVVGWWWVKRTKTFDNVHLKIIGFSVYFWILMFAEVIVYGLWRALTD